MILLLHPGLLHSQSKFEIISSDEYKFAEGRGATLQEASDNAKRELVNTIVTTVIGEVSVSKSETVSGDESTSSGLFSSYTKTYSRMQLKNLKTMELEKEDGFFVAMAYIGNEDLKESINEVKTEILQLVTLAEEKEKREGTTAAVIDYYIAYLNTFFAPGIVSYVSPVSGQAVTSVKPWLENKLRSVLSKIKITPAAPFITPGLEEQIEIPVTVTLNNEPAERLLVKIDNPDSPQRQLNKGKANLFLYNLPSARKQYITVLVTIRLDDKSEFADLQKRFGFSEKIQIEVDFSSLISVDFKIERQSDYVFKFNLQHKNLSISKISWSFGDGAFSDQMNPVHLYKSPGEFTVSLELNGDPNMVFRQTITAGMAESQQKITPAPVITKEPVSTDPVTPEPVSTPKTAVTGDLINTLLSSDTQEQIGTALAEFKSKGICAYGPRSSFVNPDRCYVVIINPQTNRLEALLEPGSSSRKDLRSGTVIQDIRVSFKGFKSVWIEVYK